MRRPVRPIWRMWGSRFARRDGHRLLCVARAGFANEAAEAETVATLEHQLDLTKRRFSGGVATAVDVAQAQTQLETVRAQLVDIGVARSQFEHAIGTIANYNLADFKIPFSPLELPLPKVPTGVPSQLLQRRPDIAAAERSTAAANEQIGIAVSAFYPTITLGGEGGFESTHAGTWIQGPSSLWSLGAQAAELLFDAGQRHALTDQARHTYEAQAAGYRNTVFQAFNDVEDQLSGLRILEQETGVEQHAVDAAQHSFDLSNTRYKGGVTSYLEVLTAEQTLLQRSGDRDQYRKPAVCREREPGSLARRRLGRDATAEVAETPKQFFRESVPFPAS